MPLDGKCQNLQESFLDFLFLLRYDLCAQKQQTHTNTETNKPMIVSEILQICLKTEFGLKCKMNFKSAEINVDRISLSFYTASSYFDSLLNYNKSSSTAGDIQVEENIRHQFSDCLQF